ncbi:MAG: C25 family cysteine peptidase [Planctomycetota bacterium]|jgi:hypothetical protein
MPSSTFLRALLFTGCALALASGGVQAEEANWLELTIDRPGTYKLSAEDLAKAGLTTETCQVVGPQDAIVIQRMKDGITFLTAPPQPWARARFQVRPLAKGEQQRSGLAENPFAIETRKALHIEHGTVYAPDETEDRKKLRPHTADESFYWLLTKPARRVEVACRLPKLDKITGPTVSVELELTPPRDGRGCKRAAIRFNGHVLGELDLPRTPGVSALTLRVPTEYLELDPDKPNVVAIEGMGRGVIRLHAIRFDLPVATAAPMAPKIRTVKAPVLPTDAEYLVIAADACADALAPLLAHRRAQGLSVGLARLSDVYRAHGSGNVSAAAVRAFLNARRDDKTPPRYVLLVGDAAGTRGMGAAESDLPSPLVDTHGNGASASDNVYVAGKDGSTPTAAIGRFPTSDPAVARTLVARTIAYETESAHGPWRRRLNMIAGEGRFGAQVDQAIEGLDTRIFSEHIPAPYELTMTYASARSPYLFVPERLGEKVIERISEGALFVSYTGHGHKEGFDSLRWKGRRYPILALDDVPSVNAAPAKRPIVTITACWTGAFDDPDVEPVGEALFEHEGGPIAVLAASRVSHPFPNALLSKELVSALFDWEGEAPRLGDMIVTAKTASMTGQDPTRQMILGTGMMFLGDAMLMNRLIADNMHLYSLLGDPALRIAFPEREGLKLEVSRAGNTVKVTGKLSTEAAKALSTGHAIVTLEVPRDRFATRPAKIDVNDPGAAAKITARYEAANDKALVRVEALVLGGAFEVELEAAELGKGKYFVKAMCWNESATFVAAETLTVEEKK